jgi:hypothetical protein
VRRGFYDARDLKHLKAIGKEELKLCSKKFWRYWGLTSEPWA